MSNANTEVKRYEFYADMADASVFRREYPDGDWVLHAEYDQLAHQRDELRRERDEAVDALNDALGVLIGCCIPAGGVDDRKSILDCQQNLRAILTKLSAS